MALLQEITKEIHKNSIGYVNGFTVSVRGFYGEDEADKMVSHLFRMLSIEIAHDVKQKLTREGV